MKTNTTQIYKKINFLFFLFFCISIYGQNKTTLPNYLDVAEFINADHHGTFHFDSSYRPTPLKCSFYGIKELGSAARGNNIMNEVIFDNLVRILEMGK